MRNLQLKARLLLLAELIKNILLIILANKEIKMVKRKHPCIYKDNNRNTYFVKKSYVDSLGKSQILFKRGFHSIKEAEMYLTDFMANHKNDCTKPLAAVIKDYLDYCEKEKDLRPSTLKTRTCILNTYILPYFDQTPINEIHQRDIIAWHQQIKRDHPNLAETYKYEISKTLIFVFKYAVNILNLKDNVAEKCGCIGHARVKRDIYWTLDEYNAFINALRDKQLAASNHIRRKVDTATLIAAFNVLFYMGLRIGELMGLTLASINLDNKTLTVNKQYQDKKFSDPKTKESYRTLPLCNIVYDDLCKLVDRLVDDNPNQRLFESVNPSNIRRALDSSAALARVKRIRLHDLRHSCSALLFSRGVTALEAQKYLGHSKIATTQDYYGHVYDEDLSNLAKLLD